MIHFIAVPNGSRQINYCFKFTFELKMPFLLIADYYKANLRLCDPIGWHLFASKCVRTIANDFLASLSHWMSFYLELLKLSLLSREWMEINKFCFCIEWTVRCLSLQTDKTFCCCSTILLSIKCSRIITHPLNNNEKR